MDSAMMILFRFKEKKLETAVIQIYQYSTDSWHVLPIDTKQSENEYIVFNVDISDYISTEEDVEHLEIRFLSCQ